MPKKINSIVDTEQTPTLRRSPRLLQKQQQQQQHQQQPEERSRNPKSNSRTNFETPRSGRNLSSTPNVSVKKTQNRNPERDSKNSKKALSGSRNCDISTNGLRRSSRSSKEMKNPEEISCLRRSPRFLYKEITEKVVEKEIDAKSIRVVDKEVALDLGNAKVKKRERKVRSNGVGSDAVVGEAEDKKVRDGEEGNKEIVVRRKRKRCQEGNGVFNGWTKQQEAALQWAYLAAKPTPHFWKKVARMVPGKSAQDCFNKVQSDHLTPPQPQPRSRVNKTKSSPLGSFSLSASKLLKTTEPKTKRPGCNKQKSRIGQKAVRHLLRKHNHVDQDYEADLFSVLEPNIEPSTQNFQQSVLLSTPVHDVRRTRFLQESFERSSSISASKKPLSRFSSLCPTALISPPVLKQVKNRALHEKYIDQLHNREAKRKAASARAAKSIPRIESRKENHCPNLDVVKAALVSDARDAITQFQHLQANVSANSSEFDDDGVDTDTDDEGEDGP